MGHASRLKGEEAGENHPKNDFAAYRVHLPSRSQDSASAHGTRRSIRRFSTDHQKWHLT